MPFTVPFSSGLIAPFNLSEASSGGSAVLNECAAFNDRIYFSSSFLDWVDIDGNSESNFFFLNAQGSRMCANNAFLFTGCSNGFIIRTDTANNSANINTNPNGNPVGAAASDDGQVGFISSTGIIYYSLDNGNSWQTGNTLAGSFSTSFRCLRYLPVAGVFYAFNTSNQVFFNASIAALSSVDAVSVPDAQSVRALVEVGGRIYFARTAGTSNAGIHYTTDNFTTSNPFGGSDNASASSLYGANYQDSAVFGGSGGTCYYVDENNNTLASIPGSFNLQNLVSAAAVGDLLCICGASNNGRFFRTLLER